jgi:transcriptional regulator with XRE-family HTH domain
MTPTEKEFYKALGERLYYSRIHCGLSSQDMGKILNVSHQQVQKYTKGTDRISLYRVNLWAIATKTHIEDLLGILKDDEDAFYLNPVTRIDMEFAKTFKDLSKPIATKIISLMREIGKDRNAQ